MEKSLRVVYVNPSHLRVSKKNSRTHSSAQISQIANSIKEFGWTNPILTDENGEVIAGAGRLAAAMMLGEKTVPTIQLAGLSKNQRRAYLIADNKLALNAGWDHAILLDELRELMDGEFDVLLTGFEQHELDSLFSCDDFAAGTESDQGKLDKLNPKFVSCPKCGNKFDARERSE